jgi:hypothetical protein
MRLKTLNGAPLSQELNFDEHALLTPDKCTSFLIATNPTKSVDDTTALKWRRLEDKETRLSTGWSQPHLPGSGRRFEQSNISMSMPHFEQTSAFLGPDSTGHDTTMDLDEQPPTADTYLQHSFVFHDTLLSSQVAQDTVADQTISTLSFLTTSFNTTASELSSPSRIDGHSLVLHVPPKMTLTPLVSLPSARHLRSIYPQTPTPNVVCVLMTHPERREILVRKGGYKMDLYEITVADDTKSSLKVSFWLRPSRESNHEQPKVQQLLRRTLEDLTIGDVLLLRNIALTSFRDTVYGQSLNPSIARARTTIDVLMKASGVSIGQLDGLPAPFVETFTRVKRWARTHVVTTEVESRKRRGTSTGQNNAGKRKPTSSISDEYLPPDTLESI